jgi:Malectin domain
VNQRIFDVLVEGLLVIDNLDIIRDAPGKNVPLIVTVNPFVVTDGFATIDFTTGILEPSINGIEVIHVGTAITVPSAPIKAPTKAPVVLPVPVPVPVPVPTPVSTPITTPNNILYRINCGSANQVIVPPNNVVWSPDQYVSSGLPKNTCGNITNNIYCTSRYFQTANGAPFRYDLPVPVSNRTYEVRLHFAEQVRLNFNAFNIKQTMQNLISTSINRFIMQLINVYLMYLLKVHL